MPEQLQRNLSAFLEGASKAADVIRDYIRIEGKIRVVSHYDADGLAAAGILGKALNRMRAVFSIRIVKWIDSRLIEELATEEPSLTVFTDLGGGNLDLIEKHLSQQILILDHHETTGKKLKNVLQVNPHLYGIDGSKEISGAGVTYLVAKALDEINKDLAPIAVVGALADIQDRYPNRSLGGVNKLIVEEAVNAGKMAVDTDLLIFGRETRPIHKALAKTMNPFIPGISGEEDKALAFLVDLGIKPKEKDRWRVLRDLSEEEKKLLYSKLATLLASKGYPVSHAQGLIGTVYTLIEEEPWTPLRDAREFSLLLNAAGRMKRPSLGVSICMGDRGSALEEVSKVLSEYRTMITKFLSWALEEERLEELESIYLLNGGGFINDSMIGTVATILLNNLPKEEKPLIAFSIIEDEGIAKFSSRGTESLVEKGLNLGEVMRLASKEHEGNGGGHDIAAGAQVPIEKLNAFIKMVDALVGKQLEDD